MQAAGYVVLSNVMLKRGQRRVGSGSRPGRLATYRHFGKAMPLLLEVGLCFITWVIEDTVINFDLLDSCDEGGLWPVR